MREGLRIFIDFTHWWKTREEGVKEMVENESVKTFGFQQLKLEAKRLTYAKVKIGLPGQQYKPQLPRPPEDSPDARISYFRSKKQIGVLGEKMLSNYEELSEKDVRQKVGEESFDYAYKKLVSRQQK